MSVYQPVMLIAGIPGDRVFAHMCYIATHLSQMLPNFRFEKICKERGDWQPWLEEFCKVHSWSHTSSPLVWRKVGAGNASYVGGATQFWEFIYKYYGIESRLTENELKALKRDSVQEFEVEGRINTLKATQRKLNVAIVGGDKSLRENLVAELFLIEKLSLQNGMVVKLYNAPSHNAKPNEQIKDIDGSSKASHNATIVQTISAALLNCDILITLDEILRQNVEAMDDWLNRNRIAVLNLAAQINDFAPDRIKVIFCSTGPSCFNAGVLAAATRKLDANDIVVISAYKGLEILDEMLSSAGMPLAEIGCPPVWGFLGINHFVDVCNTVQRHEIYRPNNRALRPHKGTTLPLGVWHAEIRSIFYMMHDKEPHISFAERKVVFNNYFYGPICKVGVIRKCKAVCDLLRLWYDESCNADGEIISLGICSDGTFGIPRGMFFSQPVYLKERKEDGSRIWVPCSEFSLPNHPNWILNNLIETARILVKNLIHLKLPSIK